MVQIIPHNKQPSFMQSLLGGAAEALPGEIEKYSDKLLQNKENQALKNQYGIDLQGIQDPNLRHTITADELAFARKRKLAEGTQNVNYGRKGGEVPQTTGTGKEGKNFPQAQTQGQKIPLMTPDQLTQEGQRIAAERTQAGVPTSVEDGINLATTLNENIARYNQLVEADVQANKAAQIDYGARAKEKLLDVYPKATPEQQEIFSKFGENEGYEAMSEADANKALSKKATEFKNTIANVRDSVIEPKRLFGKLKQSLLGTGREAEKERNSVRVQVQPLLDLGLYDTARMILADKGYYPEEREEIISSLGEPAKKAIATMPKISGKKESIPLGFRAGGAPISKTTDRPFTESEKEVFNNTFNEIIKADPAVNLILLRKAFREKGGRWDLFKDAVDTAIINGDLVLTPDQKNQNSYLESPELDNLEAIMHTFQLGGR
jgi:hypothetical protein